MSPKVKEQVNSSEPPRQPKCTRCRHHGLVVPQKGHSKRCPFLQCACWKCLLITERTRINALQRKLIREEGQAPGRGPTAAGQEHQTPRRGPTAAEQEEQAPRRGPTAAGQEEQTPRRGPTAAGHKDQTPPDRGARQAAGGLVCPRPVRISASWVPGSAVDEPTTNENITPDNNPSFWRDPPVLHLPVWRASYPPRSNVLVNVPWSAVPGLYEGNLSALMMPPPPPGYMYTRPASPEPEPPGDSRPVYVSLRPPPPESHHQEALSD